MPGINVKEISTFFPQLIVGGHSEIRVANMTITSKIHGLAVFIFCQNNQWFCGSIDIIIIILDYNCPCATEIFHSIGGAKKIFRSRHFNNRVNVITLVFVMIHQKNYNQLKDSNFFVNYIQIIILDKEIGARTLETISSHTDDYSIQ